MPGLSIVLAPVGLRPYIDQGWLTAATLQAAVQGIAKLLVCHRLLPRADVTCSPPGLCSGEWWAEADLLAQEYYDGRQDLGELARELAPQFLSPDQPVLCLVPSGQPQDSDLPIEFDPRANRWYWQGQVDGRYCVMVRTGGYRFALPQIWWRVARGCVPLLFPVLRDSGCDVEGCIASPPRIMPGTAPRPPALLCGRCMGLLPDDDSADNLSRFALWVLSNSDQLLGDIGRQREGRILSLVANGERPMRVDNSTLIAHAERVRIVVGGEERELRELARMVDDRGKDTKLLLETVDSLLEPVGVARGILRALAANLYPGPVEQSVAALDALTPYADSFLHATTKRGRDHAGHAAATALFCQFLLDSVPDGGTPTETLARHGMRATGLEYEDLCLATWFAAMFHDVGYPFSQFLGVRRLIDRDIGGGVSPGRRRVPFGGNVARALGAVCNTLKASPGSKASELLVKEVRALFGGTRAAGPKAAMDRLRAALPGLGLEGWLQHPTVLESLRERHQGDPRREDLYLINHGFISAVLCAMALRAAAVSPSAADSPRWLAHALQAVCLHDFELGDYAPNALGVSHPFTLDSGKLVGFSFCIAPVAFMLRLADKVHAWERYVHGRYELIQEVQHVEIGGAIWPIGEGAGPTWLTQPTLGIILADQGALDDAEWDHEKVHKDLRKYLAELPFPKGVRLPPRRDPPTDTYIRYRMTLPLVDPGRRDGE